jgi:hypothetical protein
VRENLFTEFKLKAAIVFCSCLLSCTDAREHGVKTTFFEVEENSILFDTLALKIDSLTVVPETSQLLNGDSTLFFFNKSLLSLEFYGLYSNDFERIRLEPEGPNGLGGAKGIYFFSNDTIVASYVNELILFNKEGRVYNRIKLELDGLGSFPDLMVQGTKPVLKFGHKLIVALFPHLDPSNKSHLKKWKSFVEIDLKTGKAISFGDLPEEMINDVYGINFLNFSFVRNEQNELIISFAPLNDLFKIDLESTVRVLERINLPNPNFTSADKLPDPKNNDMRYVMSHYLFQPSFDAIYFNGNNYLRILQKPISEDEFESMSWAKQKTLIMYDTNFNVLYAKDLNSKSLSYNMIFPLDHGYVSRITSKDDDTFKFLFLEKGN